MKKHKVLYINDYSCSEKTLRLCEDNQYPESHLWGMKEYVDKNGLECLRWHKVKKGGLGRLSHILEVIRIFFKNWRCDVIYSALPGYDWAFLLAKKFRLYNYRIITVVHHPSSRLLCLPLYDRLIFISKVAFMKYNYLPNAEYLFWGPDLNFYKIEDGKKEYNFISAGKTHRDYNLMNFVLSKKGVQYRIFGDKSSTVNEISYPDLMSFYSKSKYVCIPMKQLKPEGATLIGLTSFVDAIALGLPVLISDNSLIGVDIEHNKLGKVYKAEDFDDFERQVDALMNMNDDEYEQMRQKCLEFSKENSFAKFSNRICSLIDGK